jgi:hypothetical protein
MLILAPRDKDETQFPDWIYVRATAIGLEESIDGLGKHSDLTVSRKYCKV